MKEVNKNPIINVMKSPEKKQQRQKREIISVAMLEEKRRKESVRYVKLNK